MRRSSAQVKTTVPVAVKSALDERARTLGLSTSRLVARLVEEAVGGPEETPPGLSALRREAAGQKAGERPRLTMGRLVEVVGPGAALRLVREAGGARVPFLDVVVAQRRREVVAQVYANECRDTRRIAAMVGLTPKHVRRILRAGGRYWPPRRRTYWEKRDGAPGQRGSAGATRGRLRLAVLR